MKNTRRHDKFLIDAQAQLDKLNEVKDLKVAEDPVWKKKGEV